MQLNLGRADLMTRGLYVAALKTLANKQDTLMLHMHVFQDMNQDP